MGEAIKSGKTIDRLLVQKGLKDSAANKIIEDAKSRGIKIFFREKEALDRESREGRHQGFLAEITAFENPVNVPPQLTAPLPVGT